MVRKKTSIARQVTHYYLDTKACDNNLESHRVPTNVMEASH